MVSRRTYIPDRGDIVWLNFNPVRGHEQKGKRPALVVSSEKYNAKSGLALVCPITSHVKGYPFEVVCEVKDMSGAVLADQIRGVDWRERSAQKISTVPESVLTDVQTYVKKLVFE
jgi:mRNA interferase MazF